MTPPPAARTASGTVFVDGSKEVGLREILEIEPASSVPPTRGPHDRLVTISSARDRELSGRHLRRSAGPELA